MIGIIGKTHGVKMAASPNPKAMARKAQMDLSSVAAGPVVDVVGLASEYPAGIGVAEVAAAGSTVKRRGSFFGFRRDTGSRAAYLIPGLSRNLNRARRGSRFHRSDPDKNRLAFKRLGIRIEVGVVLADRLGLQNARQAKCGILGNFDRGCNRGRRRGNGIQMPAFIDFRRQLGGNPRARLGCRRSKLQRPVDVIGLAVARGRSPAAPARRFASDLPQFLFDLLVNITGWRNRPPRGSRS